MSYHVMSCHVMPLKEEKEGKERKDGERTDVAPTEMTYGLEHGHSGKY